jgi:diaminopimelate decarboxylase
VPNFTVPDSVFREAAERFQTPFHIYDERGIRDNCRKLKDAFSWCGSFKEYFAVKALPNPAVMRILLQEDIGFDCSSLTELMLAEAVGASGGQMMFSANDMPPEEFGYARKLGAHINLDDITHIRILNTNGGIPECVCLRFNPGGDFLTGTVIMGKPGEAKYGMTRSQLSEALTLLKRLGVTSFGLHAFLSSNSLDSAYYPALADLLFRTALELHRETGMTPAYVNLSGGIGIPYRPEDTAVSITQIGLQVKAAYQNILLRNHLTGVRLFTELGRYLTGPYGFLVTRAIHEKHIHKHYIGVDASACHLMRPAMYGAYHHLHVCGKRDNPPDHLYDVVGALCENNDKFAADRRLPETKPGDLIVIHDTGAHGASMGYNYNGRLRCAEVLLETGGSLRLIRRAETPRDYFATLDCDPAYGRLAGCVV